MIYSLFLLLEQALLTFTILTVRSLLEQTENQLFIIFPIIVFLEEYIAMALIFLPHPVIQILSNNTCCIDGISVVIREVPMYP
jgi:hypothetical protein